MTSDIHALSGAYAVDALDDRERAEFEQHLARCETCRAEVDSLRETTALLAETSAVTPPPALRDRVLGEIATVRPLPPEAGPAGPTRSVVTPLASRRRRLVAGLVAAAAAVVLAAGGVAAWQPWDDDGQQVVASPVERVLAAKDAERYTQTFPDGARATLVRSERLNGAVLLTEDMPPPPAGKVYELWLQQDGLGMVPAGLMVAGEDTVLLEGDPATALAAGITVEPAGGSPEPTSEPVALFAFE